MRRALANLLDRPGGRAVLAHATSAFAHHVTNDNSIGVKYDGMWIDVVDGVHIPRSPRHRYYTYDLERMRRFANERLDGSIDYWTFIYKPKDGDTILDIGAGVGVDAIALSRLVGATGRIHSVEAHPWTFSALERTCTLNCLNNVTPHHCAISDGVGEVWIETLGNDEENSISKQKTANHVIGVPAIDLDSFIERNNIGKIDMLKMNIEGAEELAIKGMSRSIGRVEHIAIACHDFCEGQPGTKDIVRGFLQRSGFEIFERPEDPRPYVRDHLHGRRVNSLL